MAVLLLQAAFDRLNTMLLLPLGGVIPRRVETAEPIWPDRDWFQTTFHNVPMPESTARDVWCPQDRIYRLIVLDFCNLANPLKFRL